MKEGLLTRDFVFGWIALFCSANITYMLNSTITEFAVVFGAGAALSGLVSGMYTLGGLFTSFFGGSLLSRFGWKKPTMLFAIAQVAACALYFLIDGLTVLLIVRFVHGLAFGGLLCGSMTIGTSTIPEKKHGFGMGAFMLSTTLAVGIGPFFGSLIVDGYGSQAGFFMAIVLSVMQLLAIACSPTVNDPNKSKSVSKGAGPVPSEAPVASTPKATGIRKYIEPAAVPICICILLFGISYAGVQSFVRLWSQQYNVGIVAYFFLIQCVVQFIAMPTFGKIQDKTGGDNFVVTLGLVIQVLCVASMFFMPGYLSLVLCAIGTAMGYNTLKSVTQAIATRGVSRERHGFAVSTFWLFTNAGNGLGPVLVGAAVIGGDYSYVFLASSIICLIGLPVYYLAWGRKGGKRQVSASEKGEVA